MRCMKLLVFSLTTDVCKAWTCPLLKSTTSIARSRRTAMEQSTALAISHTPFLPDIDVSPSESTITVIPRTHTKTSSTESTDQSTYLVHKGRAVDMIKRCVCIEGLTLSKGWTPQATEAFKIAIEAVVRANPILAGRLVEEKKTPWPWSHRSELRIIPNAFPPESHSFLTTVDPPNNMASLGEMIVTGKESTKDLFKHVHSNVAPYLLSKVSFSKNQIEDGSPLFEGK